MPNFNHFDSNGNARMVDLGGKEESVRTATAVAYVRMRSETADLIDAGGFRKGDVIGIARLAGIAAAKQTAQLIPLCHLILLEAVDVEIKRDHENSNTELARFRIATTVRSTGKTGVEMEAMTASSIAALTIYDMCKGQDREMVIEEVGLLEKRGGASGHFVRHKLMGKGNG